MIECKKGVMIVQFMFNPLLFKPDNTQRPRAHSSTTEQRKTALGLSEDKSQEIWRVGLNRCQIHGVVAAGGS